MEKKFQNISKNELVTLKCINPNTMHIKLLVLAFQKAEEEIQTDKVLPRAKLLSDFILEDSKEPYGEKILGIKFNSVKDGSKKSIRLKKHAEEALSHYLGYEDYADFLKKNNYGVEESTIKLFLTKNKIAIVVSLIIIITVLVYSSITKQRWMIWQEDHYVEVKFDLEKYDIDQLKIYKEERIKNFKKLKATCDTDFFNDAGKVKIWYGKNSEKKLEYFTDFGLHPETGTTLKPITKYMIKTHICKTYR